jgi:hypothetical protein
MFSSKILAKDKKMQNFVLSKFVKVTNLVTSFLLLVEKFNYRFLNLVVVQCPLLNRITLGQHKSDNNNQMIQITDVFCVLLRYDWATISDYNKRLTLFSVIQLSGGHCGTKILKSIFC